MFKWRDDFTCNIKEIDDQHKKLFELGYQLYTIASAKDDHDYYDEIMKILTELKDYTIYHFESEEKLMGKYGYAEIDEHKEQHRAFIDKINQFSGEDFDKKQKKALMDMIIFIADWIEKHILKTDLKYKEFFNSKGLY